MKNGEIIFYGILIACLFVVIRTLIHANIADKNMRFILEIISLYGSGGIAICIKLLFDKMTSKKGD
jgi:hypothetical protein